MIQGKEVILISLLLIYLTTISAQNQTDVVRYFNTTPSGTARMASMAGSFGALGGDLSTPLINPAGSAIYRKSDFGLSPGMVFNSVESNAEGESAKDNLNKFVFSNIGFASSSSNEDNKDFYINYSMGFSKTMDINRKSEIEFVNNSSSMLFSFTNQANGIFVNDLVDEVPFTSYLAYENYLIDDQPDTPTVYTTQPQYENSFNGVKQKNSIDESGRMGEIFFNFSAAIMEEIFIGATMSLISGKYEQKTRITESTLVDSLLLDQFTFAYNQSTDISGLAFKLGIIYKPENWLRLGLAWHIPYKLNLNDNFSTSIESNWKDGDYFSIKSPDGYIEYSIKNPGKVIFSAAYITGFKGLLNLDVEWMNYASSQIISSQFDFSQENRIIAETLKNTFTVRLGGELWFGRFNFRLGYAYRENPYLDPGPNSKSFYNTFSGGLGFLTDKNLYVNASLSYNEGAGNYYPYAQSIAPLISSKYNNYSVLLSAGKRF